jgi:hypothetical protein
MLHTPTLSAIQQSSNLKLNTPTFQPLEHWSQHWTVEHCHTPTRTTFQPSFRRSHHSNPGIRHSQVQLHQHFCDSQCSTLQHTLERSAHPRTTQHIGTQLNTAHNKAQTHRNNTTGNANALSNVPIHHFKHPNSTLKHLHDHSPMARTPTTCPDHRRSLGVPTFGSLCSAACSWTSGALQSVDRRPQRQKPPSILGAQRSRHRQIASSR